MLRHLQGGRSHCFFSWPSRGNAPSYILDEATIKVSEKAITDFLVDFVASCGAEKVHVIAHFMGNRGLLRALQRIAANAETRGKMRFGQIFLAAPDVDRGSFFSTSPASTPSTASEPLSAARAETCRFSFPHTFTTRHGRAISCPTPWRTHRHGGLLGHSYFAEAEALLHDIFDLMRHGEPPQKRQRLSKSSEGGASFWKLKR